MDADKDSNDRQCCTAAEQEGDRYTDQPDEYAVKEEGDDCFPAGAQGEIGGVQKGILRHEDCHADDKISGQRPCLLACLVKHREIRRQKQHDDCHASTAEYGKGN